jgi:hypothetical protein
MLTGPLIVPSLRPDAADACNAIASIGMWFAMLLTKNENPRPLSSRGLRH